MALVDQALETLQSGGHQVIISDLYAMGFDPVSDRRNFSSVKDANRLDQQVEERFAAREGGFTPELQAEMDKLAWCDVVIFQFPIWWLGMPAIMKGWIDKVFAVGCAYGGGRWFDRGMMHGKRAMLSVTFGGSDAAYSVEGIYGPVATILQPINHGILAFVGFDVIEPFLAFAPGRMDDDARQAVLGAWRDRIATLNTAPTLPMLRSDDYENFVRRQG